MNLYVLVLLLLVVLPGFAFMEITNLYRVPEWAMLTAGHQQYQSLAVSGASEWDLSIAQAAENRHRLNCFAEGVRVLLGGLIAAVGIHGICTLPHRTP